jgi:hypothetical protein
MISAVDSSSHKYIMICCASFWPFCAKLLSQLRHLWQEEFFVTIDPRRGAHVAEAEDGTQGPRRDL